MQRELIHQLYWMQMLIKKNNSKIIEHVKDCDKLSYWYRGLTQTGLQTRYRSLGKWIPLPHPYPNPLPQPVRRKRKRRMTEKETEKHVRHVRNQRSSQGNPLLSVSCTLGPAWQVRCGFGSCLLPSSVPARRLSPRRHHPKLLSCLRLSLALSLSRSLLAKRSAMVGTWNPWEWRGEGRNEKEKDRKVVKWSTFEADIALFKVALGVASYNNSIPYQLSSLRFDEGINGFLSLSLLIILICHINNLIFFMTNFIYFYFSNFISFYIIIFINNQICMKHLSNTCIIFFNFMNNSKLYMLLSKFYNFLFSL